MTSPLDNVSRRRSLSADALALVLAGLIAIAVVTGLLPNVSW